MGVYVPGVSMPKDGRAFISYSDGDVRRFFGGEPGTVGTAAELPPHGRLLDEEQIVRLICEQRQDEYNRPHRPKMMWSDVVNVFEWLFQWTDTIILADPPTQQERR